MLRNFSNRPSVALFVVFIATISTGTSAIADTNSRFRASVGAGPAFKVAADKRPLGIQASLHGGLNIAAGFSVELGARGAIFTPTLDSRAPYSLVLAGAGVAYQIDAFSTVNVRLSALPFAGLAFEGRQPALRYGALVGASFLIPLGTRYLVGLNVESPLMFSPLAPAGAQEEPINKDAAIIFTSIVFGFGHP